jgi:hypothetical protein
MVWKTPGCIQDCTQSAGFINHRNRKRAHMQRLFVSELHLCQHCPRLFGYACRGEKDAWRVGHKGSGNLPGKRFHTLADQVFRHITQDQTGQQTFITALQSPDPDIAGSIREYIKNEFFHPISYKTAPASHMSRSRHLHSHANDDNLSLGVHLP